MPFFLYNKGNNTFSNDQIAKKYLIVKPKLEGEFSEANRCLSEDLAGTDFVLLQQIFMNVCQALSQVPGIYWGMKETQSLSSCSLESSRGDTLKKLMP